MKNYYKRYLILAILGAAIIGFSVYLFLHNYLDRIKIVVAARDLKAGTVLTVDELKFQEYYSGSVPENCIILKEEITGKQINTDRRENDFISADMFGQEPEDNIFKSLSPGEVLVAIEVTHSEPILSKLRKGDLISIVSTEREKELTEIRVSGSTDYDAGSGNAMDFKNMAESTGFNGNYMDKNTIRLSENIIAVDGQVMVRNLEIIEIAENKKAGSSILVSEAKSIVSLYFTCSPEEAPVISRLTKEDNYKIIFEKIR